MTKSYPACVDTRQTAGKLRKILNRKTIHDNVAEIPDAADPNEEPPDAPDGKRPAEAAHERAKYRDRRRGLNDVREKPSKRLHGAVRIEVH
jgi:hypothetical protein